MSSQILLRRGIRSILESGIELPVIKRGIKKTDAQVTQMKFQIRGYDKVLVEATSIFLSSSASNIGAVVASNNGQPMDINRWSVLSSPHVHKTAWTQFERRTHIHIVEIEMLPKSLVGPILWYLQQHLPPDVRFDCFITENIPLNDVKIQNCQPSVDMKQA